MSFVRIFQFSIKFFNFPANCTFGIFLHRISFLCKLVCVLNPALDLKSFDLRSFVEQGFLVYIYHIRIHSCFSRFFEYCDVVPILRRSFCCCCPRKLLFGFWGRPWRKSLYLVRDVFDNVSKVRFFDLEVCQMFSRNFFPNKFVSFFCRSSESYLRIRLLCCGEFVSANTCKTVFSRKCNSMLVAAAE